jgi:hypothetical protein
LFSWYIGSRNPLINLMSTCVLLLTCVCVQASANVSNLDVHIAEYSRVITDLRGEITRLKRELTAAAADVTKPASQALDAAEAAVMEGCVPATSPLPYSDEKVANRNCRRR